jgi:hypothetical protein
MVGDVEDQSEIGCLLALSTIPKIVFKEKLMRGDLIYHFLVHLDYGE